MCSLKMNNGRFSPLNNNSIKVEIKIQYEKKKKLSYLCCVLFFLLLLIVRISVLDECVCKPFVCSIQSHNIYCCHSFYDSLSISKHYHSFLLSFFLQLLKRLNLIRHFKEISFESRLGVLFGE